MIFQRRHPPPGAVPGALAIPPGAQEPQLRVMDYTPDRLTEIEIHNIDELEQYSDPHSVTWLDIDGLGDEQILQDVGTMFGLHPLLLADVVNVGQRPKIEAYEGMLVIITRMMRLDAAGRLDIEQLGIVLGPDYVLTFQEREGDVLDPVRSRIRNGALVRRMKSDYLAYALLDTVIDGYYPVLETLGECLEDLEDEVVQHPTPASIEKIHRIRRELIQLRRSIWPQRDALSALIRDNSPAFSDAVRLYLRDTFDHTFQVVDVTETYRELAGSLMEVYLSSIGQRTNEVMKVLTIVSTIFIPLTFIVGVYGMNFDVMPELRVAWAYYAVWTVMIAIAGGMLWYFRSLGWIGSNTIESPQEPGGKAQ